MSLLNSIGGAASAWISPSTKAKAFARADQNGDGSLDKVELQAAFDKAAAKTGRTARDAEKVIARIDQDGDGAITRLEIGAHARELRPEPASTVAMVKREASANR